MKSYLIDSDILIDLFNKQKSIISFIERLSAEGNLFASVLSISELSAGWNTKQTQLYLPQLYDIVQIATITQTIAELAGELRYKYRANGRTLPTIDTLIAATCIVNDYCLATRNVKDYPITELQFCKI
jgi:predicted nucleic acid-binding protein